MKAHASFFKYDEKHTMSGLYDDADHIAAINANDQPLVVEYKGADRWSNDDSQEKRIIGQLWEDRSNGQCLFIMPKGKDISAIRSKLLQTV